MNTTNYGVSLACLAAVVFALSAAFTTFGPFAAVGEAEASGVIVFPKQDRLVEASGTGDYVTVERVDVEGRSSTLVRIDASAIAI